MFAEPFLLHWQNEAVHSKVKENVTSINHYRVKFDCHNHSKQANLSLREMAGSVVKAVRVSDSVGTSESLIEDKFQHVEQ